MVRKTHCGAGLRRAIFALTALLLLLSSCSWPLDTERLIITPHPELELSDTTVEAPEVTNRNELRRVLYDLLLGGQTRGTINVFDYDGDIEAELFEVRDELFFTDAVASYALSELNVSMTPIVSYYEIQVELVYRRTREQIEGITTASTVRYLRSELMDMMSNYRADAAIRTSIREISDTDVLEYLTEIYYENPLSIVMLPITTVTIYPENHLDGTERLIELTFDYSQPTTVLQRFSSWLRSATGDVAAAAAGSNDAEILLSLCEGLIDLAVYDEAAAELSEYPTQSLSITAYGALLGGSAIGEGYAMAFKALCDELSIPCRVVRGTRNDLPHAWNIVNYDGQYYHIDPALCDTVGFEEGFFKTDEDMTLGGYDWERELHPACNGTETYLTITE